MLQMGQIAASEPDFKRQRLSDMQQMDSTAPLTTGGIHAAKSADSGSDMTKSYNLKLKNEDGGPQQPDGSEESETDKTYKR